MNNRKNHEFKSHLHVSPEVLMAFHEQPSALRSLTPPPIFLQVLRDGRTSLRDGELEFNLWVGPIPLRWRVTHKPGPTDLSFTDHQLAGPMAYWNHDHIFEATHDGSVLIDRVSLEHKPGMPGVFTRLLFDGMPLKMFFAYRHWRTKYEIRKLEE